MTVEEIFSALDSHLVKGLMMHEQMADYYDFLNLAGYKRLHEYQFISESVELRGLHRYYVNHFEKLLPDLEIENPRAIPYGWYGHKRMDIAPEEKKRYIRDGIEKWVAWETDTKTVYQKAYKELCEIGEIAAAGKIKKMIDAADQELKRACRMRLSLKMIDYDLTTIYLCQDEIHEEYREKEQKIGIDIC